MNVTNPMKTKGPGVNVSEPERWASIIGGGTLVAYGLQKRTWGGFALAALGGLSVYRGASGHCDVYHALGINTRTRQRNESVPYELGIRVDQTVTINKSPQELYRFWRNFENLPKFMRHLDSVEMDDNRISHWVACAPLGTSVSWDAEVINEVENRVIGWRSLPGSQVDNAGSVQFRPNGNGGTDVLVELQYNPPAGYLGAAIAKLFGRDPNQQIREDLQRFKELMETGGITGERTSAVPRDQSKKATDRTGKKMWDRDAVTSASEESFPASDPPSWTPETLSAS